MAIGQLRVLKGDECHAKLETKEPRLSLSLLMCAGGLHICTQPNQMAALGGAHGSHSDACAALLEAHFSETFFRGFDDSPKSGIYCKAPLNTAAAYREAKEDRGDAAKAAQRMKIEKSDFVDRRPKTDVYYEAQLIAARQADEGGESR